MKIVDKEYFRSDSRTIIDRYDMVRLIVDMDRNEYRKFISKTKKEIEDEK